MLAWVSVTWLRGLPRAKAGSRLERIVRKKRPPQPGAATAKVMEKMPCRGRAGLPSFRRSHANRCACAAICFQAVCHPALLFCPGSIVYRLRIGVRRRVASPLLIACPFQIVVLSRFAYRRPTASHRCPSWSPWGCRESCSIAQDYRTKAAREAWLLGHRSAVFPVL